MSCIDLNSGKQGWNFFWSGSHWGGFPLKCASREGMSLPAVTWTAETIRIYAVLFFISHVLFLENVLRTAHIVFLRPLGSSMPNFNLPFMKLSTSLRKPTLKTFLMVGVLSTVTMCETSWNIKRYWKKNASGFAMEDHISIRKPSKTIHWCWILHQKFLIGSVSFLVWELKKTLKDVHWKMQVHLTFSSLLHVGSLSSFFRFTRMLGLSDHSATGSGGILGGGGCGGGGIPSFSPGWAILIFWAFPPPRVILAFLPGVRVTVPFSSGASSSTSSSSKPSQK